MDEEEFKEQVEKLFNSGDIVTAKAVCNEKESYCQATIIDLGNFAWSKIADSFESILEEILLNYCPKCERINKSRVCVCKETEVV